MRRLRIVAPVQLSLISADDVSHRAALWATLPEAARAQVLVLLARLIARGVLVDEEPAS